MRIAHMACSAALFFGLSFAAADVTVLDNIGANDGSGVDSGAPSLVSQIQTEKYLAGWDIIAVTPFSVDGPTTLTSVEVVLPIQVIEDCETRS